MISAKDFGAVGDGVTDATVAIQEWANQTGERNLGHGTYLISKPIVFPHGGSVLGYGGEIKLSDNFLGHSVFECKGTPSKPILVEGFHIDMNFRDAFFASEKESSWVTFNYNIVNNTSNNYGFAVFDFKTCFELDVSV